MGYEEVKVTPAISLGGVNKKTGKANPTSIEGYFLRTHGVPDKKKKSGVGYVHDFQTKDGVTSVWGKTDLDKKLSRVVVGAMTKVIWTGKTKPTPNGDMQLYQVMQDKKNIIEVDDDNSADSEETADTGAYDSASTEEETSESFGAEEGEDDPEEEAPPVDEAPPVRVATTTKRPTATVPSSTAQKKVQDILNKRRTTAA